MTQQKFTTFATFDMQVNMRLMQGTVVQASTSTATVSVGGVQLDDLPVMMNCQHGRQDHAAKMLRTDDPVWIAHTGRSLTPTAANSYIVARVDGPQKCAVGGILGSTRSGQTWEEWINADDTGLQFYSWTPSGEQSASYIWGEETGPKASELAGHKNWHNGDILLSWIWASGRYKSGAGGNDVFRDGAVLASCPVTVAAAGQYTIGAGTFLVVVSSSSGTVYTKQTNAAGSTWIQAAGDSFTLNDAPVFGSPATPEFCAVDKRGVKYLFSVSPGAATSTFSVQTTDTYQLVNGAPGDPVMQQISQLMFVDYSSGGTLIEVYGTWMIYKSTYSSTGTSSVVGGSPGANNGNFMKQVSYDVLTTKYSMEKYYLTIAGDDLVIYEKTDQSAGSYSGFELWNRVDGVDSFGASYLISNDFSETQTFTERLIEEMDLRSGFMATYLVETIIDTHNTGSGEVAWRDVDGHIVIDSHSSTGSDTGSATKQSSKASTLFNPSPPPIMTYTMLPNGSWSCDDSYGERFDRVSRLWMKSHREHGPWTNGRKWTDTDGRSCLRSPYIRAYIFGVEYAKSLAAGDEMFSWVYDKGALPYVFWGRGSDPFTAAGFSGTNKAIIGLYAI